MPLADGVDHDPLFVNSAESYLYSAPYPNELERRLAVLPQKPEIVVVDHMGLFKS